MYLKYFILISALAIPMLLLSQEICDNGIDDDGDSFIDLNDEECSCTINEPISLIPNPSFEDQNCCPETANRLDCALAWIQASEPTTDYIHTCGYSGWDQFPPPMPFPDGDGIMGFRDGRVRLGVKEPFWKEYAGACLLSPLKTDTTYRFQFDIGFVNPERSPAIDVTFYGTTDCDNLPFGIDNKELGCPSNEPGWFKLASKVIDGGVGDTWVNAFLDIVPDQDIQAIAIGPSCELISSEVSIYYFFDNLLLTDFASFPLLVEESGHPCSEEWTLTVLESADFDYQWYLNGIALVGETSSQLVQNHGDGNYQVQIIEDGFCKLSQEFEHIAPTFERDAIFSMCDGEVFIFGEEELTEEGNYTGVIEDADGCELTLHLTLEVIGSNFDTVQVLLFQGQTYSIGDYQLSDEGDHPLTLESSLGCDSLVVVQLEYFDIFIPNVFSPSFDSPNHVFKLLAADTNITQTTLTIYDRWGNLLYHGPEWTGINAEVGVYIYMAEVEFVNGESQVFYGDVTLVR